MINRNRKKKVPDILIDKILEDIRNGDLVSNQILESENELVKKYKAGRGSLREAIRALELVGILKTIPGKGTYVNDLSINLLFNPAMIIYEPKLDMLPQLIEFRELFESIIIEMSINNIKDEDLELIKNNLELSEFYIERDNLKKFSELDYEFHKLLADSTHNEIVINIFKTVYPLIRFSTTETIKVPDVAGATIKDHNEIFLSLKAKDKNNGKKTIKRHMEYIKKYVEKLKSGSKLN